MYSVPVAARPAVSRPDAAPDLHCRGAALMLSAVGLVLQAGQPVSRGLGGIIRGETVMLDAPAGIARASIAMEKSDAAVYSEIVAAINCHSATSRNAVAARRYGLFSPVGNQNRRLVSDHPFESVEAELRRNRTNQSRPPTRRHQQAGRQVSLRFLDKAGRRNQPRLPAAQVDRRFRRLRCAVSRRHSRRSTKSRQG